MSASWNARVSIAVRKAMCLTGAGASAVMDGEPARSSMRESARVKP